MVILVTKIHLTRLLLNSGTCDILLSVILQGHMHVVPGLSGILGLLGVRVQGLLGPLPYFFF